MLSIFSQGLLDEYASSRTWLPNTAATCWWFPDDRQRELTLDGPLKECLGFVPSVLLQIST